MNAFADELSKIAAFSGDLTSALVGAVLMGSGATLLQRPSGQTDRLLMRMGYMTPEEQKGRRAKRMAASLASAGIGAAGAGTIHRRLRQVAARYVQDVVTPSVERTLVRAEEVGRVMSKQVAEDISDELALRSPEIGKSISDELTSQGPVIGKGIGEGTIEAIKGHLPRRSRFFR